MNTAFLVFTLIVLLLIVPFMVRAIRGPTVFDRVIGVNAGGAMIPLLLILVGITYDRLGMFIDLALALFLLNLFTTLLIARYVREKAEVE